MANNLPLRGAIIASAYMLTACASPPKPINENFSSHIFANDNKQFTYSLHYLSQGDKSKKESRGQRKRSSRAGGHGEGRREQKPQKQSNKKQDEAMMEQAMVMLDQYMSTSGYCREGYLLLEQSVDRRRVNLRGECNELATEADRKAFPNAREDVIRESTFPAFISLPKTEAKSP